jgi:polar amino acid transport system ATP-binding protein
LKLEIDNLSKRFGDHQALDRLSFRCDNVHSLVLIGPSGSGKSTLLRVIGGLEDADSGSITINGQRLGNSERERLNHRRTVGTVFQALNLFPHLSALANIAIPLEKVHGRSPREAEKTARDLLARFGLGTHALKKPAELSGGERQRVAIARAISIGPRLLLFDEPTSALDPATTAEVLDTIQDLRDEGRELILVTHQMAFAHRVADHVAFLANGRIVESGSADVVLKHPAQSETRDFLAKVLKY